MLAAARGVEVGEHQDVVQHLTDREGINAVAQQVSVRPRPRMCVTQWDCLAHVAKGEHVLTHVKQMAST